MTDVPAEGGILDTSTVILLGQIRDPADLPAEPLITAVTLAELSVGPFVATDPTERAARQARLQQAEADFEPLPFDAPAARAFGAVSGITARLRQQGPSALLRRNDRRDRHRQRIAALYHQHEGLPGH